MKSIVIDLIPSLSFFLSVLLQSDYSIDQISSLLSVYRELSGSCNVPISGHTGYFIVLKTRLELTVCSISRVAALLCNVIAKHGGLASMLHFCQHHVGARKWHDKQLCAECLPVTDHKPYHISVVLKFVLMQSRFGNVQYSYYDTFVRFCLLFC